MVEIPVPTAVSVTFAPGTTALEASRTVPTTVAVSNCARAGAAVERSAITPSRNHRTIRIDTSGKEKTGRRLSCGCNTDAKDRRRRAKLQGRTELEGRTAEAR